MAKTPLALFSADWHIRKHDRVWTLLPNLWGDTAFGLHQLCDIADRFEVPYIWMGGDAFEIPEQRNDAIDLARRAMNRLNNGSRRLLYVQGQHERVASDTPPLLSAIDAWPVYLSGQVVTASNGLRIEGLDYQNPGNVEAALKGLPDADILLTHQVWRDFMGEDRGDAWMHWVPLTYQLIATGDYHTPAYQEVPEAPDLHVLSPGTLCMQSVSETPDKSVVIIYDDLSVETVPLLARKYYTELISSVDALDSFVARWPTHDAKAPQGGVPPEIGTNLLRVSYRADITEARALIQAVVGEQVHLLLDPLAAEREPVTVDQTRRHDAVMTGGMEGVLNEFYDDDPQVLTDAIRLHRAEDVNAEIVTVYQEAVARGPAQESD
jgi:hypothetical protein